MSEDKIGPSENTGKVMPDSPFYDVIEDAYRVFDYPKPTRIGVCEHCCMDLRIEKNFFHPEVRDLPLHYVQNWYQGVSDDPLSKSIWGYLLPRLLEILASGEDLSTVALEIGLSRFSTGDSSIWTEQEWDVLDRFQRQYLAHEIHLTDSPNELDEVLCMFGLAGWPLENLFEQLLEFENEVLASKLWRDWCSFGVGYVPSTAFWEKEHKSEVLALYTARPLYDRMVAYGMDDGTSKELSDKALEVADTIRIYAGWCET